MNKILLVAIILYFAGNVGVSIGFMIKAINDNDEDPMNKVAAIVLLFVGTIILIYALFVEKEDEDD